MTSVTPYAQFCPRRSPTFPYPTVSMSISGMVTTFGDSEYGTDTLIALWDSSGYLLVSENNGTGGKVIQPKPGDRVVIKAANQ